MSSNTWMCLLSPFPCSSSTVFISPLNLNQRRLIRSNNSECLIPRNDNNTRTRVNAILSVVDVDPWSPSIDSQSIASQLFAFSLFPYLAFLYFITKSNSTPKLTLFGFYFLLTFVAATVPAGIYAKVQYGTSLSNVDWLHGGAESFLTLTNLFIVMGLREALRNSTDQQQDDDQTSI